jgi:hypothetical protein
MKNTAIQISIPQPCHEDWLGMTPADKGRFCDKCMKNVMDFTAKTDREILDAYAKDQKLCGRFKSDQLNRDIAVVEKKSTVWLATTSAIMTIVGVESSEVLAQEKQNTEQHENFMLGKMIAPVKPQTKVIKGVVSDGNEPIPGANVVIKGTKTSTQTDLDGNFSLVAKENDVIVVSAIDIYEQFIVDDKNFYNIKINEFTKVSTKEAYVGGINVNVNRKKRTFFGRIFHSIGNWFR